MTQHFVIATAGHVDHGKSALVKVLTGTDPDRLPEEKARGITIDLGFAHLALPSPNADAALDVGIIDVPGHEDFVRHMVAGAGAIDLALMVVAADDGWMPQTEEHLQILTYLGITRAVLVITKVDLVEGDESVLFARVRHQLRGSAFETAPIVGTSVVSHRGLDELKVAIARQLADARPAADIGKPRLAIDRAFTLQGVGTVVTGTLRGGGLRQGQDVVIEPGTREARIRTIQTYNHGVESAGPGTRTALNLAGVDLAAAEVRRGQVVTVPHVGRAHPICDVLLERSDRLRSQSAGPLRNESRIRFHSGTANVPGRVLLGGCSELRAGERCFAQIRLETPVFVFAGDRFVIRDWAERATFAGGVIVDPCATRKSLRAQVQQRVADNARPAAVDLSPAIIAQLQRHRAVPKTTLLRQSNFSSEEIAKVLSQLAARGLCVVRGDNVFDPSWWSALVEQAQTAIDSFHRAHPERIGLPLAELQSSVRDLASPEVFGAVTADMLADGFVQAGSAIKRAAHQPGLPPQLQPAGARIRAALALKPLEPPSRKELAPDRPSQEALAFLLRAREAVELSSEVILASGAFARTSETVRAFLRQHRSATVSELRQAIGASRRVVVPLLEKLDRDGVTRREGDRRVLKS